MSGKLLPRKITKSQSDKESEPDEITTAIGELESCQTELDKLNEKENEEIVAIEQNFKKLRQHHFNQRNAIIESIPDFWFNVFTSHPDLCNVLFEEEEDCLHYLTKVDVQPAEHVKSGYSISLHFMENPYFKNEVLIKEFIHDRGNTTSVSTKIDWKKPRPAQKLEESATRKRAFEQPQSFFTWFADNDEAGSDIIAEIIKDDVWPNPLQYYLVADDENEEKEESSDSSDDEVNEANGQKAQTGDGLSK